MQLDQIKTEISLIKPHSPKLATEMGKWFESNFDRYKEFQYILDNLQREEGGYSNHPEDPGGETNWGITKNKAVEHGYLGSMRDMPKIVSEYIYIRSYIPVPFYTLSPVLLDNYVDFAVNGGLGRATRFLQTILNAHDKSVTIDGIPGPITAMVAKQFNPYYLICLFRALVLEHYTSLPTWHTFGRGWARRTGRKLADVQL